MITKERRKALIEVWYHEMWNCWNQDVMSEILTSDITFRGSLGVETVGIDGLLQYVNQIQEAFPDFHNEIELIISDNGSQSFAKLKYSGTHKGVVFSIAPTNKKISYAGSAVFTFRENRISEVWVLGDVYGLIKQLEG